MKNLNIAKQLNNNYVLAAASSIAFLSLIAGINLFKGQGEQLSIVQSLQLSPLARGMFLDIGALSTLASIWILFSSKLKIRYVFAVAVLFVGSFALLPYLIIYFLFKTNAKSK